MLSMQIDTHESEMQVRSADAKVTQAKPPRSHVHVQGQSHTRLFMLETCAITPARTHEP